MATLYAGFVDEVIMRVIGLWAVLALLACGTDSMAGEGDKPARDDVVQKTDAQWRAELTPKQYRILRAKGTEPAFTSKYWQNKAQGIYQCAGCGLELFSSEDKFRSGTGWPSYTRPIGSDRVAQSVDNTLGVKRTEILCRRCGGHLGHVFSDGPPPTRQRFCVNGNALAFKPVAAK
jgi:peptide-methionine (R)-S-oxide reductase